MDKTKRTTITKTLNDKMSEVCDQTIKHIIAMMQDANVAFISFATSGNDSFFDVDTASAISDWAGEPTYGRVEAIYCDIRAEHPSLCVAMHINDNSLCDILENGNIAYPPCDEVGGIINKYGRAQFYGDEELYDRPSALNELMYSVMETLDLLPNDRLQDGEIFRIEE